MKVAVYLIVLCLFLMAGADRVFADGHARSCCYARTYHHETFQEGKRGILSASFRSDGHSLPGPQNSCLNADGPEEENMHYRSARTCRAAVKYLEGDSFRAMLNYHYHPRKSPPSFRGMVTDRYLQQRVIRV